MSDNPVTAYHPPDPFLYQAAVVRVVTPTTYDLQVDVGFHMSREVRVHLRGAQAPDGYDPSDDDHRALTAVSNWFEAAAVGAAEDYPLWIRTYKRPDPEDDAAGAEPGEDMYEADMVRRCDADNLREYLTDTFPGMENGVDGDQFSFFRGRSSPDCSDRGTEDDPDQS